jgi:RNA polymerase sigma factor (sigma-70 family)
MKEIYSEDDNQPEWFISHALIHTVQAGDRSAFEQFGRRLISAAYTFTHSVCNSRYSDISLDREDIIGTAVHNAIRKIDDFRFDCPYHLYFSRIVRNAINTELRRRQSRTDSRMNSNTDSEGNCIIEIIVGGDSRVESAYKDEVEVIMREVASISNPDHRRIATMWIEGYSYDEIAGAMRMSSGGVGAVIHRIKGWLRSTLEEIVTTNG